MQGSRRKPQRKDPSRALRSLCALCVSSALFALRHARTPLFNAKVAKVLDERQRIPCSSVIVFEPIRLAGTATQHSANAISHERRESPSSPFFGIGSYQQLPAMGSDLIDAWRA